jgi:hypothetical protein
MVTTLLEPASRLSGIALPDQAAFAALRAAHGDPAAVGAPAAGWIHLLALTLALLVVLPRLLLATACFGLARWRAARFAVPLDAPYYRRIAGLRRGTPAQVQIWPYARAPSARAALALRARCAEAFGPRVGVDVEPTVAFGTEDDVPLQGAAAASHAIALFDLSATPERENQGRFVARLAGALAPTAALAVVVDASGFRERFGDLPERLAQRREAWRAWAEPLGLAPCFLDLEAPAEPRSADALEAAFAVPMRERTAATR